MVSDRQPSRGCRRSGNELAGMYYNGEGVPRDLKEAARIGTARQPSRDTLTLIFPLGFMYSKYRGRADRQLYRSGDRGIGRLPSKDSPRAQLVMGFDVRPRRGRAGGYSEAVKWHRKAAEQGDADAQYNLAFQVRRVSGEGVPKDDREAVKWIRKGRRAGPRRSAITT